MEVRTLCGQIIETVTWECRILYLFIDNITLATKYNLSNYHTQNAFTLIFFCFIFCVCRHLQMQCR